MQELWSLVSVVTLIGQYDATDFNAYTTRYYQLPHLNQDTVWESEKTRKNITIGPQRGKTCLRGFTNNTDADQPAHPRSLISAFVIPFWKVSYVILLQMKFQFSS